MSQLLELIFSGHYVFERRISSPRVSFTGTATFEKGPSNQILYREEGDYSLGNIEQRCYQKRIFVVDASGLSIYRNDNSLLHEFRVDNMPVFPIKLNHIHHCKDDFYSLTLDLLSNDSFSTSYVIEGPSKNYTIHTAFMRVFT
jgi:hypothetical protein